MRWDKMENIEVVSGRLVSCHKVMDFLSRCMDATINVTGPNAAQQRNPPDIVEPGAVQQRDASRRLLWSKMHKHRVQLPGESSSMRYCDSMLRLRFPPSRQGHA